MTFESYRKKVMKNDRRNYKYIEQFEMWLKENKTSARQIDDYFSLNLFLNNYLTANGIVKMEDGPSKVPYYLEVWFWKYAYQPNEKNFKNSIETLKIFYEYICTLGKIDEKTYTNMCDTIDKNMAIWLKQKGKIKQSLITKKTLKPQKYKITAYLHEYKKEIYRIYMVNDNMTISNFCEAVILSMNGDLSHLYEMNYKYGIYICDYMNEEMPYEHKMENITLKDLSLKSQQRLDIRYDFGDEWIFEIKINKVFDGHDSKQIILLEGKGCGIEEDSGGPHNLYELIIDKDNEWGYNYNSFNLDEINKMLDKRYNKS